MQAHRIGHGRRKQFSNAAKPAPSSERLTKELFREIVQGARASSLAPANCIPYVRMRKRSESGIRRLMASYRGDETGDSPFNGVSTTGSLPMVVPLVGDQAAYPKKYFTEVHCMDEEGATHEVSKFATWYGIVEGEHRNEALRRLSNEAPQDFLSFSWTVLVLRPAPLQMLRAFCRNLADKQRSSYVVATTLFDSILSLQQDISLMRSLHPEKDVTVRALCHYAMGYERTPSETMRFLAKRALSLSPRVVNELGEILNAEEPDVAYSRVGKSTPKDTIDCRVFRKVVIASTFRSSRAFFNNSDPDLESNQICALQRIKDYSRANDFKTCPGSKLDEMYIGAKKASREIAKFEAVLDGDPWPLQMQVTRANILHTTQFDSEISLNDGNDSTILPYLADSYKKCCPALCGMKIAKWERSFEKMPEPPTPASHLYSPSADDAAEQIPLAAEESCDAEGNSAALDSIAKGRDRLCECGISILPISPEAYAKDIVTPDYSPNFDFILTEVPANVSAQERILVVKLLKRVLKAGSALFAIVSWKDFFIWHKELQDADFFMMPHPFVMVPRTSKLRKTRAYSTPQEAAFFAVVAFAPGRRVDGFEVDLSSPYTLISHSHKRKFAVIDDVVPPIFPLTKRGTRSPLVKTERNVNMLCEILATFSPPNSAVFDPFGGPLTTACASLLAKGNVQCYKMRKKFFPWL